MHNDIDSSAPVERLLIEAIAKKRMISATYNGNEMLLAPHHLFARHGALFVRALNARRNWRSDDERQLGQFKLDGLSGVSLQPACFEPLPNFDSSLPHAHDESLFSI